MIVNSLLHHSEAVSPNFFMNPKFCCAQKNLFFEIIIKTKILPPKFYFSQKEFKIWLQDCTFQLNVFLKITVTDCPVASSWLRA